MIYIIMNIPVRDYDQFVVQDFLRSKLLKNTNQKIANWKMLIKKQLKWCENIALRPGLWKTTNVIQQAFNLTLSKLQNDRKDLQLCGLYILTRSVLYILSDFGVHLASPSSFFFSVLVTEFVNLLSPDVSLFDVYVG